MQNKHKMNLKWMNEYKWKWIWMKMNYNEYSIHTKCMPKWIENKRKMNSK